MKLLFAAKSQILHVYTYLEACLGRARVGSQPYVHVNIT